MDVKQFVNSEFTASARLMEQLATELTVQVAEASKRLVDCLLAGNKILIFGNGGSAADAQHFAAELVGRYRQNRPSLPALALTTDTSLLTAIGNDFSFDEVFERQVQAFAGPGDVVIGISTSGRSSNVVAGLEAARKRGSYTLAMTGANCQELNRIVDLVICVPSTETPRIQEAHGVIIHILCGLIEQAALQTSINEQPEDR